MSASQSPEKFEKEKAKKKEKKDKKEKERADRDVKDKESNADEKDEGESTVDQLTKAGSGKSTPALDNPAADPSKQSENDLKSPVTESTGVRTPTGRKPARNPWTLFMRMAVASINEGEVKEFFGEAQSGVMHFTHLRPS
jgi:hypothetical protein